MKKIGIVFVALLAAVILLPSVVSAQEATPAQVKALYARWTQVDAWFAGYEKDLTCTEGVGYVMTNSSLVDGTVDALNPEAFLMSIRGDLIGAQYQSTASSAPSLFGQAFTKSGGVWKLNVWFIPNASGMYADKNPAVSCILEEPGAGAAPPPSGDMTLPWGIIAIVGVGVLGVGVGVLRKNAAHA